MTILYIEKNPNNCALVLAMSPLLEMKRCYLNAKLSYQNAMRTNNPNYDQPRFSTPLNQEAAKVSEAVNNY